MKAIVVASIIATHELAVEFNVSLTRLAGRRKEVVSNLSDSSDHDRKLLTFEYDYRVVSAATEPFLPPEAMDNDPIRVVRTWLNKEAWDSISRRFGVRAPSGDVRDISGVYCRVGKTVVKINATGIDMLKSNVEVSDDQWSALKKNDVTELLKDTYKKAA